MLLWSFSSAIDGEKHLPVSPNIDFINKSHVVHQESRTRSMVSHIPRVPDPGAQYCRAPAGATADLYVL